MQKLGKTDLLNQNVIPIPETTKISHLMTNIHAADVNEFLSETPVSI